MSNTQTLEIADVQITLVFRGSEIYETLEMLDRRVSPWIHSMTRGENGSIALVIQEDTGEFRNVALTPKQITDGFAHAVRLGLTHCGNYRIEDLDNADSCFPDLILQMAIYSEIVWG